MSAYLLTPEARIGWGQCSGGIVILPGKWKGHDSAGALSQRCSMHGDAGYHLPLDGIFGTGTIRRDDWLSISPHQHRIPLVRGQLIASRLDHVLFLEHLRDIEAIMPAVGIFKAKIKSHIAHAAIATE
jgi:hypothetical protein